MRRRVCDLHDTRHQRNIFAAEFVRVAFPSQRSW